MILAPIKVITKAILVCPVDDTGERCAIITVVDGKTDSSYPPRLTADALEFASCLAQNDDPMKKLPR